MEGRAVCLCSVAWWGAAWDGKMVKHGSIIVNIRANPDARADGADNLRGFRHPQRQGDDEINRAEKQKHNGAGGKQRHVMYP